MSSDKLKMEISLSQEVEATDAPFWIIVDPEQMMKPDPHHVASMIKGIFFSRESAEKYLKWKRHHYSDRAVVYCHSGYDSDWGEVYREARLRHNLGLQSRWILKDITVFGSFMTEKTLFKAFFEGDRTKSAKELASLIMEKKLFYLQRYNEKEIEKAVNELLKMDMKVEIGEDEDNYFEWKEVPISRLAVMLLGTLLVLTTNIERRGFEMEFFGENDMLVEGRGEEILIKELKKSYRTENAIWIGTWGGQDGNKHQTL